MLDPEQFRILVIRPPLERLKMWSPAAENLLLGTAITESGLEYLKQIGGGPALSLFQIEPATHDGMYRHYLRYRPEIKERVLSFLAPGASRKSQLITNLAYATAICRLKYYRKRPPLPAADDLAGLDAYWKTHYNTKKGKGKLGDFVKRAGPFLA